MLTPLLISFFILLIIGVPIAFAMGISSLFALIISHAIPLVIVPQRITVALDSFPFVAVPLFVLAGSLMNTAGVTERLINFAKAVVGHFKGGLSYVNVLASMLFAGVSGSATADAAGIGKVLVPAMINEGYDEDLSLSVTAASATIGPIIPPSITMVIYSSMTGLSIGKLFLAGIIPGILFGVSQMVVSYVYAKKRKYPKNKKESFANIWAAFKKAILPMITPIIIIVGIVGGVFTATEAGAVAVVYTIILGVVYKKITIKNFFKVMLEAGETTAIIMLIIACASVFGWILAIEQFPLVVVSALTSFTNNPIIIYLIIIAAILIIGMFIEGMSAMIMLVPVLTPIVLRFGFDPLHFALVIILCLSIGSITPPVGILLFTTSGATNLPIKKFGNTIWVFAFAMLIVILLVTFIPQLATAIPNYFI